MKARDRSHPTRPKAEESYIDPEAMQIPVGSEGSGGRIGGSGGGGGSSGSLPFNGFTYNKNLSPLDGPQHGTARDLGGFKDSSYSSAGEASSNSEAPSPRGIAVQGKGGSHEQGLDGIEHAMPGQQPVAGAYAGARRG